MMELLAISPIDGRYKYQVKELSDYFSEYALIKYRLYIETEYFIALCQVLPELQGFDINIMKNIHQNFNHKEAKSVKQIERRTNHDVKAVEYYIANKLTELNLSQYKNYIHFGLTSQDINNPANTLQIMDCIINVYQPILNTVLQNLTNISSQLSDVVMLAKTHGQPASPTVLGKELYVFCERIINEIQNLDNIKFSTKFGGAVGNFNAHHVVAPEVNWIQFADSFIESMGMYRHKYTTQIDHYDNYANLFDVVRRINTILIDLDQDIWLYISNNYFKQKIKQGEVGSSTMPHKVNPIDFENSEGNLLLANTLLNFFSNKLPISRLQRDLTDSTTLRNVGTAFAHTLIGFKSLLKGLNKLEVNREVINKDLEQNWVVVGEAIQTILRRVGYDGAYEALKEFTRNNGQITQEMMQQFITTLQIDENTRMRLMSITPFNYYGNL
jgi:adenylosuccinate lyase